MDRPIAVGDLVMVVKESPCCKRISMYAGVPFVVKEIAHGSGLCSKCGSAFEGIFYRIGERQTARFFRWQLIRIDPPALADETRQDERLTA